MEELAWPKLLATLFGLWTGGPAPADDPQFEQASATIRQYAHDMSKVLPCAYLAMHDPHGRRDTADAIYGYAAVRTILVKYSNEGRGAFPESLSLVQIFAANFKPKWSVKDIRAFARSCYRGKVLDDIAMLRGAATPLFLRPPFRPEAAQ